MQEVMTSETEFRSPEQQGKKRRKRSPGRVLLIVLCVALGVFALACVLVPPISMSCVICRHIDYRGEETPEHPLQGIYSPEEFGLTSREMFLQTSDGLRVWCAEVEAPQPKGVVIVLSGIDQPSVTCYYGEAALLREAGYSTLLLELRAHGQSEGDRIGFGYTEMEDVRAAVTYIQSRPEYDGLPVVIQGVSMGGATALNAFGQLPEIDGCIAMSAYASLEDELDLEMERMGLPKLLREVELFFSDLTLRAFYGAEAVENLRPEIQIRNAAGRPVLLIACEGDESVPVENTRMLAEDCPEATVWIRDSWEHFILQDCNFRQVEQDVEFCQHILEFLDACPAQ